MYVKLVCEMLCILRAWVEQDIDHPSLFNKSIFESYSVDSGLQALSHGGSSVIDLSLAHDQHISNETTQRQSLHEEWLQHLGQSFEFFITLKVHLGDQ